SVEVLGSREGNFQSIGFAQDNGGIGHGIFRRRTQGGCQCCFACGEQKANASSECDKSGFHSTIEGVHTLIKIAERSGCTTLLDSCHGGISIPANELRKR